MTPRVAFDTNVLLYPILERRSVKGQAAIQILEACSSRSIVAIQVLLEYVAVVRRRRPDRLGRALRQVDLWRGIMTVVPTTEPLIAQAGGLIASHRFQVWGAVIWAASRAGGARFLLSEDMHDGLELGGLTAVNPFTREMAELLALIEG